MENTEKIKDMLKLLTMNEDHFHHELASLAAKVNNLLDSRTMKMSRQLLSVMFDSPARQNER